MPYLTEHNIQHNTELLLQASNSGDFDEVKRLIPVSNPKDNNSEALQNAALQGHTEIVKLLIPVSDPKAMDSSALRAAAKNGHTEIVELLIPVSDPKTMDSYALRLATEHGHTECIKLLIPVSNCSIALQSLIKHGTDVSLLQQCIDEYEALQQKERLTNHLNDPLDSQKTSTKRKM